MKAKIKKGNQIISNRKWDDITDYLIINFKNKYTYNSFKQIDNHLLIDTTEGEVDIVFTGQIPELEFEEGEKNQLTFRVIN